MNHGSLFSGIGGFDLAAYWMGWNNIFHCEINHFPRRVLDYYWPNAKSHTDIKETDFSIYNGTIDIISGGFPCQPYSVAGKRLGKEDDRHLWPEMLRAIREIQPTWVVGENVRGLISWNGGLVFDEVQTDLEAEGYEVTSFLLPACAVDAPHRRDRIWFVAHSGSNGHKSGRFGENRHSQSESQSIEKKRERLWSYDRRISKSGTTPDTTNPRAESLQSGWKDRIHGFENAPNSHSFGFQETGAEQQTAGTTGSGAQRDVTNSNQFNGDVPRFRTSKIPQFQTSGIREYPFADTGSNHADGNGFDRFPTQSTVCSRNDGFSSGMDGITFSKWRNESIKAGGNAIVPQVALQIFKAINEFNQIIK